MTIVAYSDLPRREANALLRNQALYKPHQIEMAQSMRGLIWVEDRIPPLRAWGEEWAALRRETFKRDDYTCRYCRIRGGRLECDHIIPIARGGSNDPENLATACFDCNRSKRDKLLEEWMP